jgi:hypothetical protein
VLDRLLAKDPAARPASAHEVAECLRPWCLGADLPGLLDRALRPHPPAAQRCPLAGHTTTDPAESLAQPLDLPSTVSLPSGKESPPADPASTPASRRAQPGRRSVLALATAAAALLGFPIAWRFLRPGPPPLPSPIVSPPGRPLTITAMAVHH